MVFVLLGALGSARLEQQLLGVSMGTALLATGILGRVAAQRKPLQEARALETSLFAVRLHAVSSLVPLLLLALGVLYYRTTYSVAIVAGSAAALVLLLIGIGAGHANELSFLLVLLRRGEAATAMRLQALTQESHEYEMPECLDGTETRMEMFGDTRLPLLPEVPMAPQAPDSDSQRTRGPSETDEALSLVATPQMHQAILLDEPMPPAPMPPALMPPALMPPMQPSIQIPHVPAPAPLPHFSSAGPPSESLASTTPPPPPPMNVFSGPDDLSSTASIVIERPPPPPAIFSMAVHIGLPQALPSVVFSPDLATSSEPAEMSLYPVAPPAPSF